MIPLVLQEPRTALRRAVNPVVTGSAEWLRLARLARVLSWLTLGWLGVEAGIAIGAAAIAGSAALLGFGLDSGIESLASVIVIWRFTGTGCLALLPNAALSSWSPSASIRSPPTSPPKLPGDWSTMTTRQPAWSALR